MTENNRYSYLDGLKAAGIIFVVSIHVAANFSDFSPTARFLFQLAVGTIAVPIFFLVDGYILGLKLKKAQEPYKQIVIKSTMRLLVPWVIFILGYSLFRFIFEKYTNALETSILQNIDLMYFLKLSYGSSVSQHLYFLPSLFILRTLYPLFLYVYKRKLLFKLLVFTALILLNLFIDVLNIHLIHIDGGLEPIKHAIWGSQFYMLGMILSEYTHRFTHFYLLASALLFAISLPLVISFESYKIAWIAYGYSYLIVVFLSFFTFRLPGGYIGRNTMPIYLLHAPLILKGIEITLPAASMPPLSRLLIFTPTAIFISLFVYIALSKLKLSFIFGDKTN